VIEFVDDPAREFAHDRACENKSLRKDEECRFRVTFTPLRTGGTRNVDLVIHQNLPEVPTTVPVEGEVDDGDAGSPVGDLVAPPGDVRCFHQQAGTAEGEDALQISLTLRLDGASSDELPGSVLLSAQSDRGPSASARGGVGEGRVLALPLEPEHYGQTHVVTVRVDPDNEVPETDENNNQLTVSVDLPAEPASSQELSCAAQQG
jgi:CARDB